MIDPGNPFLDGRDYASLVADLQQSVLLGVEHDDVHRFMFDPAVRIYELPREVIAVTLVTGLCQGSSFEFVAGRDYDVGLSRVLWRAGAGADPPRQPDSRTKVTVSYRFRDTPSGLTDVGPGSVTGTLLRAIGREVALLHQQVNEAYRRAFLDTANGAALDGVVALLGVTRNPAQTASGRVQFSRRQAGPRLIVPIETTVEDTAQRRYLTTTAAALDQGQLTGEAVVRAVDPGPEGNNDAGALTVMPTPPAGVDAVTNPSPISGGLPAEPDDALRERARHALERAGNATMVALEFAVRDVDGVEDVAVIDHGIDVQVPLGEVRVRYAAGGDEQRQAEIRSAVDDVVQRTRAAGVLAVAEPVQQVKLTGRMVVVGSDQSAVQGTQRYARAITVAVDGAGIGQPLSLRRLVALVFQTPGLADVLEAQLRFSRARARPSFPQTGDVGDLLPIDHAERTVVEDIDVVLVDGLRCKAPDVVADPVPIAVEPRSQGQPVKLNRVRLQVRVEVRAALLSSPNVPPVVVADVVKEVSFDHASSASLTLTTGTAPDKDLHGFRPGEHDPRATATVSLAGYPAVPPATTPLVLG